VNVAAWLSPARWQHLPQRVRRRLGAELRRNAAEGLAKSPALRVGLERLAFELGLLLARERGDAYGASYYGVGRDPSNRRGASGYERYDRTSSHANQAAYLLWRHFEARRTLDVGCAFGFVVEALLELGLDAWGSDFSTFAISHAPYAARGRLVFGDLGAKLPFADHSFDLVSAFETLEHLPPALVPAALGELYRLTGGYLVATIPSFGPNPYGPSGWFNGKVQPERLAHYQSLGDTYPGPIPEADLARDVNDRPIEGHLTIASFSWWRARFAEAGFVHCPELEGRLGADIERFGLRGAWDLYVMRRSEVGEVTTDRSPGERRALAERWGLAIEA
jgi:SAM-dependent methyltransferase